MAMAGVLVMVTVMVGVLVGLRVMVGVVVMSLVLLMVVDMVMVDPGKHLLTLDGRDKLWTNMKDSL
jgi:hypothetical protein